MSWSLPLSDAKARLSEVVRTVRRTGEEAIITVDGKPAVRVVPVRRDPVALTGAEVATTRALLKSLRRMRRVKGSFDAVDVVRNGRR